MIKTFSQALSAGQVMDLHVPGKVVRILDCTDPVTLNLFKNGASFGEAADMLAGLKVEADFDQITVYSVTAQTVKIAVADGNVSYDRFSGNVAVTNAPAVHGAFTQSTFTTIGSAAAVTVAAANAARRIAFIQNNDAAVYLRVTVDGSAPTAAHGIRIAPGNYWEPPAGYAPTGAIQAITESGTASSVEVLEG